MDSAQMFNNDMSSPIKQPSQSVASTNKQSSTQSDMAAFDSAAQAYKAKREAKREAADGFNSHMSSPVLGENNEFTGVLAELKKAAQAQQRAFGTMYMPENV